MEPRKEPIEKIKSWLDRVAPFLLSGSVVLFVALCLFVVALLVFSLRQFGIGWDHMDAGATGNLGSFVGGVLGTLLSAIASFLLVLSIYVQVVEHRRSREEGNFGTLLRELDRLKSETMALRPMDPGSPGWEKVQGLECITELRTRFQNTDGSYYGIIVGRQEHDKYRHWSHAVWITENLLRDLQSNVDRAELLLGQVESLTLPEGQDKLVKRDLVRYIQQNHVRYKKALHELEVRLTDIPYVNDEVGAFRKLAIAICEEAIQVLDKFERIDSRNIL